jgi:hypothetical protein
MKYKKIFECFNILWLLKDVQFLVLQTQILIPQSFEAFPQTQNQTDRQADGQTGKETDGLMERQTNRQTDGLRDRQTN